MHLQILTENRKKRGFFAKNANYFVTKLQKMQKNRLHVMMCCKKCKKTDPHKNPLR
jgi:hypothetical protein